MNFWEYLGSRHQQLLTDAGQHASVVLGCVVVATAIGVPTGLATCRSAWAARLATTAGPSLLAVPPLAVLGLLIPVVGLGGAPTVIALTLYGLVPVVRHALVGLRAAESSPADAAQGAGMSRVARLVRVGLPLAWPSILAGIRGTTRMLMGITAIAACASGPGLGKEIFRGLGSPDSESALDEVLAGTLGIVALTLLFDAAYVLLGRLTCGQRAGLREAQGPAEREGGGEGLRG
ncbi:ABC transporter permease [Streptomyces griseorubiginosus]|uniref:ABC transporter permease n=1 Tax=Streptomyces griseorubiginosus TaxID=67304 RepID=UPI00114005EA|nr:ABC transporter permease [Streptomyces griseorubiginosus]